MSEPADLQFIRYGRSWFIRLQSAADLRAALDADPALWAATAAPVCMFNMDPVFLKWVDAEQEGRILAGELVRAARWTFSVLNDATKLIDRSEFIRLSTVNPHVCDGQLILTAASQALEQLGESGETISLSQVREVLANMPTAEASTIDPESQDDPRVASFLRDMQACTAGLGEANLDAFIKGAQRQKDWLAAENDADPEQLYPLAGKTAAAAAAVQKIAPAMDAYFKLCQTAAFDPRVLGTALPGLSDAENWADTESLLAGAPVARPTIDETLSLTGPWNPAYIAQVKSLIQSAIVPLFGEQDHLTADMWNELVTTLTPFITHQSACPDAAFLGLPPDRLADALDESLQQKVRSSIQAVKAGAMRADSLRLLEQLILAHRHLMDLARNFISFPDLYRTDRSASFEKGTLILDGRRMSIALAVDNIAAHSKMAKRSKTFVLYIELANETKDLLVVPVTRGRVDHLTLGMLGLFQPVQGPEVVARIVKISANPISLGQAITEPFRRVGSLVGKKVDQWTAEADKSIETQTGKVLSGGKTAAPPKPVPAAGGMGMGGMLVGGGVAIAAMGSALAYIVKTLGSWQGLLTLGIVVGAILVLVSIRAILGLRKRELSAILEASGWAINTRMYLTRKQAATFCRRPKYPTGSKKSRFSS